MRLSVSSISLSNELILTDCSPISDDTEQLQLILRKEGNILMTTAEKEIVRAIKEKCCYIAANPAKEEKELKLHQLAQTQRQSA